MQYFLIKCGNFYVLENSADTITLTKSHEKGKRFSEDSVKIILEELKAKLVEVKKCNICQKEFIPFSRSDEIYCRECRKQAFDVIKKCDKYYTAYRNAYKALFARMKRHGKPRGKEDWRICALEEMEKRRSLDDYAGFSDWLKNSIKDY